MTVRISVLWSLHRQMSLRSNCIRNACWPLFRSPLRIQHPALYRKVRTVVSNVHNEKSGLVRRTASWYARVLNQYPLRVKIITAAAIGLCSDLLAQKFENNLPLDLTRASKFVLIQSIFVVPILHVW